MLIIGERINGSNPEVAAAIDARNSEAIQDFVYEQIDAGADFLDLCPGAVGADDAVGTMVWLVETVSAVTDRTLCIDTPQHEVMQAAAHASGNPLCFNSSRATDDDLTMHVTLALERTASLICLTIDERGVPRDAAQRVKLAAKIISRALELGLPMDRLFIDPVLLPLQSAQQQAAQTLDAVRQIRLLNNPAPHIVIGLSNLAPDAPARRLLQWTFLAMAMSSGLDAVILNPNDRALRETIAASEVLLSKTLYCDLFLKNSDGS